jgi:RNase P/RNase MRP subunit POP5
MSKLIGMGFSVIGKTSISGQLVVSYYEIQTPAGIVYCGRGQAKRFLSHVPKHPIPSWAAAALLGLLP